ncbi:hypothetical protein CALVIDRAFT_555866 [Calocera viscosa TUFC12733]|uniref:RING-type domain-containing protein n=1 Tax=Calocera viscosa (strain TUFC12733) TaxID=1330018 RepID=A0A167KZ80_CALVF|nr:hypothetical protein CALVIDRAFT_555866 [Calocera viscosa TUFC12733]
MSTRTAVSTTPSLPPAPTATGLYHKANVLASVQDAYWSDDEAEDNECPLCLEEMDLSDMNFKPCPCGYQICRFCWHHIKTNLNGKCPACRRDYTEEAVEFKPVGKDDQKRLAQKKRQKEKERRDLDTLGRRHLTNVRIVQRNMIYVTGIGQRFAKEELLPTLRSSEYFGQYGKITKILLVKRTPLTNSASRDAVVGLYINYYRREDAARAIAAVDGAPSPSGGGEVMRASYGTTKYCVNFLRGVPCTNQGCLDLHDWGDERDCFTKEDLSTLSVATGPMPKSAKLTALVFRKHTLKEGEHRPRQSPATATPSRKSEDAERKAPPTVSSRYESHGGAIEAPGLPKTASWARSGQAMRPASPMGAVPPPGLQTARPSVQRATTRPRDAPAPSRPATSSSIPIKPVAATVEKKIPTGTIRPAVEVAPNASTAAIDITSLSKPSAPPNLTGPPPGIPGASTSKAVPSQPARPPSLAAPPVASSPSRPPGIEPPAIVASTSSYKMTNQGKALLDDVLNLREAAPAEPLNPFPEFDRTLMNLQSGSFSFSLDLNSSAAVRLVENRGTSDWSAPASPAMAKFGITPISIPLGSADLEHVASPVYSGSFNPFDPPKDDRSGSQGRSGPSSRAQSPAEDEVRRSSRFGFARRPGGGLATPGSTYRAIPSLTSSPTKFSETLAASSPGISSAALSPLHQHAPAQNSVSNWSYSDYAPATQPSEWSYGNHDPVQALSPQAEARAFKSLDLDSDNYGRQDQISDNAMLHKMLNIGGGPPLSLSPQIVAAGVSAGPPPGLAGPTSNFANDQASAFSGSPRSGRVPVGSSGSSRMGAGSPSFNSGGYSHSYGQGRSVANAHYAAMSISNAGDVEVASVSAEGNVPDEETNLESQSVSVAVSALSSPVPPTWPLEIAATQLPGPANAEISTPSEVEAPALSESDFPALPSSQLATSSSKAQGKRPVASTRSIEPKTTASIRKITSGKKVVATANQKPPTQDIESSTSAETSLSPVAGKATTLPAKKEAKGATGSTVQTVNKVNQSRAVPQSVGPVSPEPVTIAPFISRKTRKVKAAPILKAPRKSSKDISHPAEEADTPETDEPGDSAENVPVAPDLDVTSVEPEASPYPLEVQGAPPADLSKLLNEVGRYLDVEGLTFFDTGTINTKGQSNIRYAPLVHALSTLSSGTSFTGNMPNSSIDSAVSSFQQLLETLTQTISDILHLLPRNTWDDSSSFDGVLREMLRAEDLLDEVNENGEIRDDEVASLTMALEKRARWMEHQLTKLEDLHRDINMAAVRAVLSINDRGWDATGFLPRQGDSLSRYDSDDSDDQSRPETRTVFVSAEELEEALAIAKVKEAAAEAELKQIMHRNCGQLWLA